MSDISSQTEIESCSRNASDIEDLGYRIIVPIECAIGLVASFISIVVFHRLLQQKSILSYRIYKYIAITDIVYLLIVSPLGLVRCQNCSDSSTLHYVMVHYEIYVYLPFNSMLFKASSFLIVLLSLERYCAVAWAMKYRHHIFAVNRSFTTIFIVTLLGCGLFSVYRVFLYRVGPEPCFHKIETDFGKSNFPFLYGLIASIPLHIIPNSAILIFSCLLIRFLHRRKAVQCGIRYEIKRRSITIPVCYNKSTSMIEAQRRLSTMTVAVCFTYFICTANELFYLLRLPHILYPGVEGHKTIELILFYGNIIEFIKPLLNFLLWISFDRNVQSEIRKICHCT